MDADLITMTEAAELRGASVSAISHLVRRGRLRSEKRFGKTLVYRSEVEAFEAERKGWPKGTPRKPSSSEKPATGHASAKNKPSRGRGKARKEG